MINNMFKFNEEKRLIIICSILRLLIRFRIIKNVWYKSEIRLAEIEGKRMYDYLTKYTKSQQQ